MKDKLELFEHQVNTVRSLNDDRLAELLEFASSRCDRGKPGEESFLSYLHHVLIPEAIARLQGK